MGPLAQEPRGPWRTSHVRHAAEVPRPNVLIEGGGAVEGPCARKGGGGAWDQWHMSAGGAEAWGVGTVWGYSSHSVPCRIVSTCPPKSAACARKTGRMRGNRIWVVQTRIW
eukprot:1950548-Prymnesium_polylepis.1